MQIMSANIKEASKVVGYFSYSSNNNVFCDGDACVIAGSEKAMEAYLQEAPSDGSRDIIKKTRFGEIIEGLRKGGAYAFDKETYTRFVQCATCNGMDCSSWEDGLTDSPSSAQFMRIQWVD